MDETENSITEKLLGDYFDFPDNFHYSSNSIRIVSIDIGIKNFAIYTEDVDLKQLSSVTKLPQGKRKLLIPDENQLDEIYLSGKSVPEFTNVFNLSEDNCGTDLSIQVRKNLFNELEKLSDLWNSSPIVVIEKQFINTRGWKTKAGTANMNMIRLAESCYSWLVDHTSVIPIYYPSHNKTVICGCPKFFTIVSRKTGHPIVRKATKPDRKKWSIQKGKEILEQRHDSTLLERLETKKRGKQKLDDICDCIIQAQAYKWGLIKMISNSSLRK